MKPFLIAQALHHRKMGHPKKHGYNNEAQLLKLYSFSNEELIKELKGCLNKLKIVLQTPEIVSRLAISEIIEIIACHEGLVETIDNSEVLTEKLEAAGYSAILYEALYYISIAREFPDKPEHIHNLRCRILDELSERLPINVIRIFNMPELLVQLPGVCLAKLAQHNLQCARYILNTPDLSIKLLDKTENSEEVTHVVILGQHLPEIAHTILDTPELLNKLNRYDVAKLGQYLPEIAERILNTPELLNEMDGECLAYLGQHLPGIAYKILNSSKLFNMLDANSLAMLGEHHSEIAHHILNTPELVNMLMESAVHLYTLSYRLSEIRLRITLTPELFKIIDKSSLKLWCKEQPYVGRALLEMDARQEISIDQNSKNSIQSDLDIWHMLLNVFNHRIEYEVQNPEDLQRIKIHAS